MLQPKTLIIVGFLAATPIAVGAVATLTGLAAHRMVFGINTLMVLVLVRHGGGEHVAGFAVTVVFVAAAGLGSFLANLVMPAAVRRWGRYATANELGADVRGEGQIEPDPGA